MIAVLRILYVAVLVGLGLFFGRRYIRTRNIGYIFLTLALSLWPLLSWAPRDFVGSQIDSLLRGGHPTFPFSVLDGSMTVGELVATLRYAAKLLQASLILTGFALLIRSPRSDGPSQST